LLKFDGLEIKDNEREGVSKCAREGSREGEW
jgi:hypothetical protein